VSFQSEISDVPLLKRGACPWAGQQMSRSWTKIPAGLRLIPQRLKGNAWTIRSREVDLPLIAEPAIFSICPNLTLESGICSGDAKYGRVSARITQADSLHFWDFTTGINADHCTDFHPFHWE
jgi:hypothetical protein